MAALDLSSVSNVTIPDIITHLRYFLPLYLLAYFALYFLYLIVKYRFLSPLSHYPGPFFASISSYWKLGAALSKREVQTFYEAHQKYGPIFRCGPNALAFCDPRAIKKIYGTGKGSYAKNYQFKPPLREAQVMAEPPAFLATATSDHTRARRMVGPAFSMTSILQMENQIDEQLRQFQKRLDEAATTGAATDMSKWVNYLTLDVLTELACGSAFGFLEKDEDVMKLNEGLNTGHIFTQLLIYMPAIGRLLFVWPLTMVFKPPTETGPGAAMKMATNIVSEREKSGSEKDDLVGAIMNAKDTDGTPMSRDQVLGEVLGVFIAGADTTANSILAAIGNLLKSPSSWKKLVEEVDEAEAKGELSKGVPKWNEIRKLPWLDACISEALRFSPAIPSSFERVVPPGGDEILPGEYIPGGTVVSSNNWTFGRNKEFYGPDAETYRPERWDNPDDKTRFKDYEFGFGHGQRICLGKNIATLELYKSITILARDYEVKAVDPKNLWREEVGLFIYRKDFMITLKKRQKTKV